MAGRTRRGRAPSRANGYCSSDAAAIDGFLVARSVGIAEVSTAVETFNAEILGAYDYAWRTAAASRPRRRLWWMRPSIRDSIRSATRCRARHGSLAVWL